MPYLQHHLQDKKKINWKMDKLYKIFIKRLSIISLICIILNLNTCTCTRIGGVSPIKVYGNVGKDINITCWFNPIEISSCQDSSNLTFFYISDTNMEEVSREDISIIDNTTIVYTLKNTEIMSRKYTCKCKTSEREYIAIEISNIKIGTQPQPINDFKCYSYDFEYFYCNFTAPYNPSYVKYKLEFTVSEYYEVKENGTKILYEISQDYVRTCNLTSEVMDNQSIQSCNMTIENNLYSRVHEWYTFNLSATNYYGTKFQKFRINHFDNVIPAKPELTLVNRTSNSLTFQWKCERWELFYKKKGFEYCLRYLPEAEAGKTERKDEDFIQYYLNNDQISYDKSNSQDGITIFTLSLNNLKYAYTWYDVRFNVKVRTARNDGTMWSERFNGTFHTGSRRPDSPPKTDIGSFMIDSKSIYLYWEKLPTYRENGANIQYEITSTKKNGKEIALIPSNKTSNYATFVALSNDQYEFTIKSANNVSYSYDGSIIRIPKRNEKFKENYLPQRLSKILHYNNYELSWEAPKQSIDLIDYTVFWCKSKDEKFTECEDSIHFEHVDRSKRNYTHIKGEHSLNFAVSANYDYYSSGMVWALCTASKDGDFPEMDDISLSAQKQTILITWMLSCVYLSRIEGYYLTYCPIMGSGDNCSEPAKTIVIPKNVDDRYEINNLKPYTSYMVNIRMYSKTVEGPNMTAPRFVTTLELAPSEPRNLRLVNLTSSYAVIEWTVPEYKNGDIRYYEIVYDNKQIRLDKGSFPENATTIMYRMESLKSYYNYKVYVTAMTIEYSPPSNDVPFRTWMGQPDSVSLRSNDPIDTMFGKLITWNRPQEPAGNTSFYEVIVSVKDRTTNLIKDLVVRSRVPGTNCTLRRICEDDNDLIGSVIVSVAAVNAIEKEKYDREAFGEPKYFELDDDILINNHKRKRRSTNPEINSVANLQDHQFVLYNNNKEHYNLQEDNNYHHDEYVKKEYQHNDYNKEITYNREDYRCAEHIPYDKLIDKYNNHEFFSGPLNNVATALCKYKDNSNYLFAKQENIIAAVVICIVFFVMILLFVFGFKKVKKMKNIEFILPPGLTDLNQDNFNNQKMNGGINGGIDMIIPDNLAELSKNASLESLDKNEKHCLLANSGNDSGFLHGTDYLSDMNSNSDRINDQHDDDGDNSSTGSDSIEMNDMTSNDSNNISPPQSPIVNILKNDKNFMEVVGEPKKQQQQSSIATNPMIINGYVQHSAIQKPIPQPSMNGYTTLEALGKPTTNLTFNTIPTSTTKPKQDIINSPQTPISNPMISGYVTHKQLSEFGQQSMQ